MQIDILLSEQSYSRATYSMKEFGLTHLDQISWITQKYCFFKLVYAYTGRHWGYVNSG